MRSCFDHVAPAACLLAVVALATLVGCTRGSGDSPAVVVYAALDSEFSKDILDDFQNQPDGAPAAARFDVEANKSVGLANAILAEANRPRCDVFWNNEVLNTLRLQRAGLLEPYASRRAEQFPAAFRSPDGAWYGFAARARVLIVNDELVAADDRPRSIHDLADEKWRGRCGLARPAFGTTATHAACLAAAWGEEAMQNYFRRLEANEVRVLPGNKHVAVQVAAGQLAFGLTDTDDAIVMIEQGHPVSIVYPDQEPYPEQGEQPLGTLFIPNTVAIIRGGPNPQQARALVDYLLSAEVERRLAAGGSAQIPLARDVDASDLRVQTPSAIQAMEVDFETAADHWEATQAFMRTIFLD